MKKLLVFGLGGLLVLALLLVAGGFVLLRFYLDPLLKSAVEEYGPQYTGTPVTVDSVNLSLLSQEGTIRKFVIGNPEIFTEDPALFQVDDFQMGVDPLSLTGDVIRLRKLTITNPYITFLETKDPKTGETVNNFTIVQENIEKATGPAEEDEDAPVQRIIMDLFVLEGAKVKVKTPLTPEPVELEVPRIEMENVGGAEGILPEEFVAMITKEIMGDVVVQLINQFPGQIIAGIGRLSDSLGPQVGDAAMAAYGKVEDMTGAALNRAQESIGALGDGAGQAISEGTEKAKEALRGLPGFGGDKSEEE
ncbi:MAG: hypothetical protein ACFBZ8_11595 [Opitutales bacterium]